MKKLGNILYVTNAQAYLSLDGETVVVKKEEKVSMRLPLHTLEQIICFNYPGISPALMGACARRGIGVAFLKPNGRFLARVSGPARGNVLLRKKQFLTSLDEKERTDIARSFLLGKIYNCRTVIERALRDHGLVVEAVTLQHASRSLKEILEAVAAADTLDTLRGLEGTAAKHYYGVFSHLILQQKDDFPFEGRSRRPPRDNTNALLSFFYSLLTYEVASALEGVGLDPYVGFLHVDRPGRPSLALDMMEELRPVFADRLALSLINRRQVGKAGFLQKESGGVLMDDETRKVVLKAYQERKRDVLMHPFLKERVPFGLIPHIQANLLARHLRGDVDAYPPFFWS